MFKYASFLLALLLLTVGAIGVEACGGLPCPTPTPAPTHPNLVTICHVTGHGHITISVAPEAIPAHLAHGDNRGNCSPVTATPTATATPKTTATATATPKVTATPTQPAGGGGSGGGTQQEDSPPSTATPAPTRSNPPVVTPTPAPVPSPTVGLVPPVSATASPPAVTPVPPIPTIAGPPRAGTGFAETDHDGALVGLVLLATGALLVLWRVRTREQ